MFCESDLSSLQGRSVLIAVATPEEYKAVEDGLQKLCRVETPFYTALGVENSGHNVLCHKYVQTVRSKPEEPGKDSTGHTKRFSYVLLRTGAGPEEHGTTSAAAMAILKPKHALLIGVCASDGMPKSPGKGKVVMASEAFNYEEGKWTDEAGQKVFIPRTLVHTASHKHILEAYRNKYRNVVFQEEVVFISGSAVRADNPDILQRARQSQHLKCAVLDMEASAFIRACRLTGTSCLGVVKTVLDVMNPARQDEDQEYAVRAGDAAERGLQYAQWVLKEFGGADAGVNETFSKLALQYYEGYISPLANYLHEKNQYFHVVCDLEPDSYTGNFQAFNEDIKHIAHDLGAEQANTPSGYYFYRVGNVWFDIPRCLRCIRQIEHPNDVDRAELCKEARMCFEAVLRKKVSWVVKITKLSELVADLENQPRSEPAPVTV